MSSLISDDAGNARATIESGKGTPGGAASKRSMGSASYERLLKLAHQRAVDGKGGLAASIAKMCLDSRADLNEEELALTFDILRKLIDQVEVQIRRYIADYLAERLDVPQDLLDFLANDVINVAYPILVHSAQLEDEHLIAIIDKNSAAHQMAVAKRPGLSAAVSDKLVSTENTEVLLNLLRNLSAELTPWGIGETVRLSIRDADLQAPLLQRRDLPPGVAKRMYGWVGGALRDYIERNYDMDGIVVSDAVTAAVDAALDAVDAGIDWYDEKGRDHAQRLIGALEARGEDGFVAAVGEVIGKDEAQTRTMLTRSGYESLATMCRAFGMDSDQFMTVMPEVLGYKTVQELRAQNRMKDAREAFDSLTKDSARTAVNAWCIAAGATKH